MSNNQTCQRIKRQPHSLNFKLFTHSCYLCLRCLPSNKDLSRHKIRAHVVMARADFLRNQCLIISNTIESDLILSNLI